MTTPVPDGVLPVPPANAEAGLRAEARRRGWLFGALAIAGIIASAAGVILHLRAIAVENGTHEMRNLSAVLAEQTARTLQSVDLVLGSIDGELKRRPVTERSGDDAVAAHVMLQGKIAGVPQIQRVSVVGADGAMLVSSRLYPSRGLSAADREYFTAARDARAPQLVIGNPILSRIGDQPLIMVSRRLNAADGSFAGVLAAGLDPSYFASVFKSAAELDGTAIALFRDDGTRLARYPHAEGADLGARVKSPEFARYPTNGVFKKVSLFDGQSRLYTSQRVPGYPLVITASITEQDLLAGWRQETLFIGLIAAAAIASVLALLVSLRRGAERARGHAVMLQDAVDALADGFVLYDRDDRVVMTNRKYRELHVRNAVASRYGMRFEEVFRAGIAHGELRLPAGEIDAVVRARVARHLNPSAPFEQRSGDRWLRISEHRTSDGGIVGIHADITELKQAQADAEAAQARMAQWAEAANDWFWEADEDGRMTFISDGFGKTMGIAAAARLGQRRYSLAADFDADDPKWRDHLKALSAQRPFRDFVYAANVPTGRRYISVSGAPIYDNQGRFRGYRGTSTDVTERIEAEQALTRQAEQLKTLVENLDAARVEADAARARMADFAEASNDWLWESDAEGKLTYVSDAFEKTMGIPVASRLGAPRLDLTRGLDPDNPRWADHLDTVASRRPFRDFVLAVSTGRGIKHISASGKPIYDGKGAFLGYRGTTRDVTAQIEVERAFARHTEMLASLIANLPIGVSLIGPDQRYRALNGPYLLRFGVPPDFIKPGDHIEKMVRFMAGRGDLGPGDPEAATRTALEWLWTGEAQQFERKQQDGRIFEVRRVPLPDGGYITTHVDVTEARRRERDLQEAHARLQRQTEIFSTLIEHLPVGVNLIDRDQRFMAFNRLFLDFFDIPPDMLRVGDKFERFIRHNAERGEYGPGDVEGIVRQRIELALDPRPTNFERRRPNGRVIENRRVVLPGGGFVTTYIDVTDARRRESDLEDARARLERQTIELAATAEKLNAANAAKSLFLANMSHELRTPLNAILGFSEIMREALMGPLPAKYQNYARDVHASGTYLLRLINDVLDTSKIEVGQLRLQEEPIDVADLLTECERLVADKAAEAGIQLSRELPPNLPALLADRLRIKQIVLNLLSNAIKFTPPAGEVSVAVTRPAKGGLALCISDTGIGMRREDIPLALEPFRQLDNSFTRRYEGTGLGLPLAKALIELHGGRLIVESAPQKGTRVTAWLPPNRIIERLSDAVASGANS
jgi:PAS domain S-box-containing protein